MGPVFRIERRAGERRWQSYASRMAFAAALLIALAVVWGNELGDGTVLLTHQALSKVGIKFYGAILATAIPLVMLGAPAAASGSICIDKTRGTLAHLLVTDLSASEIVLGKLFAILLPTLGWIAAGLPVAGLAALLGGVDPNALLGVVLLMTGLAFLGCSLALLFSVWVTKPHEALLITYLIFAFWILGPTLWDEMAGMVSFIPARPAWLDLEPIRFALAPYFRASEIRLLHYVGFCAGSLLASAIFVGIAIARLRPAYLKSWNRPARKGMLRGLDAQRSRWRRRLKALPSPSLDWNPVLWREWHYQRLTRWGWAIRVAMIVLAGGFVVLAILESVNLGPRFLGGPVRGASAVFVNGFLVPISLLFVCIASSSVLAEEHDRGNLDVLMATPMSTAQIVIGKWLGAYSKVVIIAATPTLLGFWLIAVGCPLNRPAGGATGSFGSMLGPWITAFACAFTICAYILAYGAMLVSAGFAFAIGLKRGSRIATVVLHVGLTIGLFMAALTLTRGRPDENAVVLFASSFAAPIILTIQIVDPSGPEFKNGQWLLAWVWIIIYGSTAAVLLHVVLHRFDRAVGRIPSRLWGTMWEWPKSFSASQASPWDGLRTARTQKGPPPLPLAAVQPAPSDWREETN